MNLTTATLEQVQRLIDKLSPLDQVQILAYLAPRIVRTVAMRQQPATLTEGATLAEAWHAFFQIGDSLATNDRPELPTLTQAVQMMRR